ncbi:Vacuolar protease A [Physocladia obscura]|uniref:Vacuolar protease A n=1 Tax=Physocladia obscura TaxID=109957 RepID=A0AAD5T4R1_9FUNG|nr:Vacuolar protease A [Physocladia obscura]
MHLASVLLTLAAATTALAQFTVPVGRAIRNVNITAAERALGDAAYSVNRVSSVVKLRGPRPPRPPKNSDALENLGNEAYIVNVTLSDGNNYTIDLDTGSSDTWLIGLNTSSPGITSLDSEYLDFYGGGIAFGDVYKGTLSIGKASATIALGNALIEDVLPLAADGLLGLAYSALSAISEEVNTTLPTNWFDASNIENKIFGFYLSNAANGDNGEVTFGGYDREKFYGPIKWLDVQAPTLIGDGNEFLWWAFSTNNITWSVRPHAAAGIPGGSGPINPGNADPNGPTPYAIADTGTTLSILPNTTAYGIAEALGLSFNDSIGWYTFEYSETASLPPVNIHFNSTTFAIPSSVYAYDYGGFNLFGIVNGGDTLSIFGDIFSRVAYTIFDKVNNRVGYATAIHPW